MFLYDKVLMAAAPTEAAAEAELEEVLDTEGM
jgi:hypothetical protein